MFQVKSEALMEVNPALPDDLSLTKYLHLPYKVHIDSLHHPTAYTIHQQFTPTPFPCLPMAYH
jgi:hypothetical protein